MKFGYDPYKTTEHGHRNLYMWRAAAMAHWQEWTPKRFKRLEETNNLIPAATEAARKTMREIRVLMQTGMPYHEAEVMVREKYVFVPPEKEVLERAENPNI